MHRWLLGLCRLSELDTYGLINISDASPWLGRVTRALSDCSQPVMPSQPAAIITSMDVSKLTDERQHPREYSHTDPQRGLLGT